MQSSTHRAVELENVVNRILKLLDGRLANRAGRVAITGIDGSGKGYIASQILAASQTRQIQTGTPAGRERVGRRRRDVGCCGRPTNLVPTGAAG